MRKSNYIQTMLGAALLVGIVACSDHNPNSVFNPNSKLYDSTAAAGVDTAAILKPYLSASCDAKCAQDSANAHAALVPQSSSSVQITSSQAQAASSGILASSEQVGSSIAVSSGANSSPISSSSLVASSAATGYAVTVVNGFIAGETSTSALYSYLSRVSVQMDTSKLQMDFCFAGWTTSDSAALSGVDLSQSSVTFLMPRTNITMTANITSCANEFTDKRDGAVYKYMTVGTHVWMAQNLRFVNADTTNWCYNAADTAACDTLGRLYSWSSAQTACPAGWRLPTLAEIRADQASLKLPEAGNREAAGAFSQMNGMGFYWTSGPFSATFLLNQTENDNPQNCTDASTCGVDWILNGTNHYAQRDLMTLGFSARCIYAN